LLEQRLRVPGADPVALGLVLEGLALTEQRASPLLLAPGTHDPHQRTNGLPDPRALMVALIVGSCPVLNNPEFENPAKFTSYIVGSRSPGRPEFVKSV